MRISFRNFLFRRLLIRTANRDFEKILRENVLDICKFHYKNMSYPTLHNYELCEIKNFIFFIEMFRKLDHLWTFSVCQEIYWRL